MSSHSSDVYIMNDSVEASATPSTYTREGLVRSSSATPSECSTADPGRLREVERIVRSIGSNTEQYVETCVSALLRNGIMELMQTVAGDGFARHVSMKSCGGNLAAGSRESVVDAASRVMQRLKEVNARHRQPPRVMKVSARGGTPNIPTVPDWLEEVQLSMTKTDSLLRELSENREKQSGVTDATQMTSPFLLAHTEVPTDLLCPQLPLVPPPEGGESCCIQELELKLRMLEEKMAETRVVLAKEGVDSVIPLYNELLDLRETRRQAALRDTETTMAYLTTQDCCFRQLLASAERRKRLLDVDLNRRCCEGGGEGGLATLTDDVEKLAKLGRELNFIRTEYRRSIAPPGAEHCAAIDLQRGEKRFRTSDGCLQSLVEAQLKNDEELMELRRELDEQRRKSAEWKRRYELAFQSIDRPQDSTVFHSLLRDVEARLSEEFMRRNASLCRLFGWELLELSESSVNIARFGYAEEQLTLPLPELSRDQRSATATSIVLAKKIIEGRAALCEQRQQQQQLQGERHAELRDDHDDDDNNHSNNNNNNNNNNDGEAVSAPEEEERGEGTQLMGIPGCELYGEIHEMGEAAIVGAGVPSPSLLQEGERSDETPVDSAERLEPSFYSSGLWDK